MPYLRALFFLTVLAVASSVFADSRAVETFEPKHRTAADLEPVATAVLADEGTATVHAGTNTLILVGSSAALARTLAVLREQDRPLRSAMLHYRATSSHALRARGLDVVWRSGPGELRFGHFEIGSGSDGELGIALRSTWDRGEGEFAGSARLLEGSSVRLEAGRLVGFRSFFLARTAFGGALGTHTDELVLARSGFEARPVFLGDGSIQLAIQSFFAEPGRSHDAGFIEPQQIHQTSALTTLRVQPGETVVLGSLSSETDTGSIYRAGASREEEKQERLLLLRVESLP